jgi:hypothetical protein
LDLIKKFKKTNTNSLILEGVLLGKFEPKIIKALQGLKHELPWNMLNKLRRQLKVERLQTIIVFNVYYMDKRIVIVSTQNLH